MREVDLTNAKLLYKLLKVGGYCNYEIKDICSLTTAVLVSLTKLFFKTIFGLMVLSIVLLSVFLLVIAPLSYFTVLLPEGLQAPLWMMELGVAGVATIVTMVPFIGVFVWLDGGMDFAPEYIKKPFRKLFHRDIENMEDEPASGTWVAIKEMWVAFKNKTCVKVKL